MTKDKANGKGKEFSSGKGARDKEGRNGATVSKDEKIQGYTRFVYIKSLMQGVSMTKANPFRVTEAIKKAVNGDVKNVKPLKSGDLLIEAFNKTQVEKLCKIQKIGEMPVMVKVAKQYNMTKGVIYAPSLIDMSEEEIVEELKSCKVVQARFINKGPSKKRTPLIILTFESSSLPTELKCGYLNVRVDKYIPPPLRCYKCNGFGHTANVCKKQISCTKCAEAHTRDECINMDIKCSNCNCEDHSALDRNCPIYKQEKEIMHIKVSDNISYFEAKKRYEAVSYANKVKNNKGSDSNSKNEDVVEKEKENVTVISSNINVGASTSEEKGQVDSEMECENNTVETKEIISLIINLARIMNSNPGKTTIQARQIGSLISKITKHKIETYDIIKALE